MASLSCSETYTCLAGATRPHFLAEQAQALKAEAPVGRDVCLVSKGQWRRKWGGSRGWSPPLLESTV